MLLNTVICCNNIRSVTLIKHPQVERVTYLLHVYLRYYSDILVYKTMSTLILS